MRSESQGKAKSRPNKVAKTCEEACGNCPPRRTSRPVGNHQPIGLKTVIFHLLRIVLKSNGDSRHRIHLRKAEEGLRHIQRFLVGTEHRSVLSWVIHTTWFMSP